MSAMKLFNSSVRYIILLFSLVTAFSVLSQSVLDIRSRDYIKTLTISDETRYVSVIIKLDNENVLDELTQMGVRIINRRDELVLAYVPTDKIDTVSELLSVSNISIGSQSIPLMDKAKAMCNVADATNYSEIVGRFNGQGVVVGFSDIGFDPNHINFRDESNRPRVMRLVNYVDSMGYKKDILSTAEIMQWTTDRQEEYHATHVCGILAGSYRDNGYDGIATGAEIVATTSELYDGSILAGVEDVVEYARQQGKPAVVNLSVGSYLGPHDGSDLFCQYLDRIGEEAIICISAGNEGTKQNTLSKHLKENDEHLNTFICNRSWDLVHISGASDFWSADSSAFKARMCIYDCLDRKIVYVSPYVGWGNPDYYGVASDSIALADDETDISFDSCFVGYMRLYSELNSENNRYNILFSYDVLNFRYNQSWGRYCPGIMIEASEGMKIDAYADGTHSCFRSMGVAGFSNGNSDCSVSNIACGKNVLVVGSSNSRNTLPVIKGENITYDFAVGNVSDFSGYGTLIDGRTLPHICAPGNMVVSSISTPFVNSQSNEFKLQLTTSVTHNDRDHYWIGICGTSMSSPFVAGICAMWLQADSSLDINDIKDIAMSTADRDFPDISDRRWGSGNINALAGIEKIISNSLIDNVATDTKLIISQPSQNSFYIQSVGHIISYITLYNLQGVVLKKSEIGERATLIDCEDFSPGIYLIEANAGNERIIKRIVIK